MSLVTSAMDGRPGEDTQPYLGKVGQFYLRTSAATKVAGFVGLVANISVISRMTIRRNSIYQYAQ